MSSEPDPETLNLVDTGELYSGCWVGSGSEYCLQNSAGYLCDILRFSSLGEGEGDTEDQSTCERPCCPKMNDLLQNGAVGWPVKMVASLDDLGRRTLVDPAAGRLTEQSHCTMFWR